MSCGPSLPTGEDAPRSAPVIVRNGFATVLGADGIAYGVTLPKAGAPVVTALPVADAYGVGDRCVIDRRGTVWRHNPGTMTTEPIEFPKPVKKYIAFGNYDMLLYADGSLSLLLPALLGMEPRPDPEGKYLERVDLASFPPLRDAIAGGTDDEMYILGLDEAGGVHIAGGNRKGTWSYLLPGLQDTFLTRAVRVPDLPPIRRIGKLDPAYFPCAIDAQGVAHYWAAGKNDPSKIQQLEPAVAYTYADRLRTRDGQFFRPAFASGHRSAKLEPVPVGKLPDAYVFRRTKDYSLQRYGIGLNGEFIVGMADSSRDRPPRLDTVPDLRVDLSFFQQ